MNTSLTIDMPEVALFDREKLKQMLTAFVKAMAVNAKSNLAKEQMVQKAQSEKLKLNWREVKISQEVMDMTFQNRVDLGTVDYKELLEQALIEKYS